MTAAEAAALVDSIDCVHEQHFADRLWCDVCLRPSVLRVVRRVHHIDIVDGGSMSEQISHRCPDHDGWIR